MDVHNGAHKLRHILRAWIAIHTMTIVKWINKVWTYTTKRESIIFKCLLEDCNCFYTVIIAILTFYRLAAYKEPCYDQQYMSDTFYYLMVECWFQTG